MEQLIIRPPERPCLPPFVQYNEPQPFLTPEQCQQVIDFGEQRGLRRGTIGNGGNDTFYEDLDYRSVSMRIFDLQQDGYALDWLFQIIRDRVMWTNDEHFRFDLHGLLEGIQFLRYDAEDETPGHYRWHQDFGGGYSSNRKLTVVIQLSDPSDYEGCELRMFTQGDYPAPTVAQGTGVIFPTWTPHCVTPITKGVRYSLACWVTGPQFR